jgi:DNA-directed RNA polymerase specialized sigma24 family protein
LPVAASLEIDSDMVSQRRRSCCVQPMTSDEPTFWDDAIRAHDRRVFLSVLALGVAPDRARELVQATWARLIEQHANGVLATLELPGLAIRQARFFALSDHKRSRTFVRMLASVPEPAEPPSIDRVVAGREQLARVLDAVATCSPTARQVFRLVYATPGGTAASASKELGLSLQRVRQVLCELRSHIRNALEVSP